MRAARPASLSRAIAMAGGPDAVLRLRHFRLEQLATLALRAPEGRAALLANHGVVALGADLAEALANAAEIENPGAPVPLLLAARLEPVVLDAAEMQRIQAQFADYGRPQ
ncbi:MAG: class II aldolase/adducin family protein [Steroidobacteraceae bacterium]